MLSRCSRTGEHEDVARVAGFGLAQPSPLWSGAGQVVGAGSRRISACADKRHSEQSCTGVPDERLGVSRIGLEHLERLMPGDIRDLDQVRAALHGTVRNLR